MPRPKVKPEDRQRSTQACVPCKASKIRCDAATPCGPCLKRSRADACIYLESSRKKQKTSHQVSPQFETPSLDNSYHVDPPAQPGQAISNAHTATATATPTPEPGTSRQTESRMLLSSKGEKLYVGENASLSFLQFLRQILKKYMGPSPFTENRFKENMLEVELARDESPLVYEQSRGEKYSLVQLYREASSGILDLFTHEEVRGFLDRHDALSPSAFIDEADKHAKAEQAFLNMMLAIGSQCRGQNPLDSYNAARSFTCAQKFAFEGFLCDPSLDMVRVFLLMAFYMIGACHRNAAFMYLGIASKAACALGLHRHEPNKTLPPTEFTTRWRTWKSLLTLDTIVASILGRPGGLPSMRIDEVSSIDGDLAVDEHDRPSWIASRAVFSICSHIIELEQQIGNGTNIDATMAETFLKRLQKWNETLPVELRHFTSIKDTSLGSAERELFIGATHVACTYYFTIILVTRPFFISHLVSRIRRRRQHHRKLGTDQPESSDVSDLAQACLDSAVYMAKAGYTAVSSQILSNNMRIIKAWMFAAGLLLGFSMFAQGEPAPEVDGAFQNAIYVLEQLGQLSPQARHYFEILSTFSDAIYARREQLGRERRRKSDRFVSQIFTADFHDASSNSNSLTQSASDVPAYTTPSTGETGQVDANLDPMLNLDLDGYNLDAFYPQTQVDDWTDVPLLSDNLYIDWESLWPVLEN